MTDVNREGVAADDFEILFVDDDKGIISVVEKYLLRQDYNATVADNGLKALELIKEKNFDIVFTDLNMPGLDGIELLKAVKGYRPETEVIIVTGYGTIESAIEALKLGSYDYIQKPLKLEHLGNMIQRIIQKKTLANENILLKRRLKERFKYDELVGVSLKMQEIYEIIDRIRMNSPSVLIQGESGTGKEVAARVIHHSSDRKDKPFVAVNCGAIVEGLLESELFGHVKGAFTGAIRDKIGLFRAAEGGTIFLDEVSRSSPSLQIKLLRVLQERKIRPVGDSREINVDVRVIAAISGNAEEDIKAGVLRKDLFYRLNIVSIKMPPLRERKEDIPIFVNYFLNKFNTASKKKVLDISPGAMDALLGCPWPGNVRQLENVIERAFALGVDKKIKINDLPNEITNLGETSKTLREIYSLKENEIKLIRKALHKTGGDKAKAAELLEINITTLYRKIKRYNIPDRFLQNANANSQIANLDSL